MLGAWNKRKYRNPTDEMVKNKDFVRKKQYLISNLEVKTSCSINTLRTKYPKKLFSSVENEVSSEKKIFSSLHLTVFLFFQSIIIENYSNQLQESMLR